MGIPGGVPVQRPDQLLQPRSRAGSGPAPQQTAFVGRIVITFGPTGAATGVFVYNPTIALGNLADSMTEATVGPQGETVAGQTLEQGITSYSPPSDPSRPGVFVQLHHGQINFGDPLSADPSTFTADMGVFHENTTGGPPILFINSGSFDASGTHSNIWLLGRNLGDTITESINLFGVTAAGAVTGNTLVNVVGALVMGTSGAGLPVATGPFLQRNTADQIGVANTDGTAGSIATVISSAVETWHSITPLNSWTQPAAPQPQFQCKKLADSNGVALQGALVPGTKTDGTQIGAMPAGYFNTTHNQNVQVGMVGSTAAPLNSPWLGISTSGSITVNGVNEAGLTRIVFNGIIYTDA